MIILANSKRIIAAAGDKGLDYRLIGAYAVLLAASTLLGQQAQFQGSVPTGVASPTPLSLTLRDAIESGCMSPQCSWIP
jgi:hypothetical protein